MSLRAVLMIGVFSNPHAPSAGPAASVAEWRSHFGAWAINSSPLVLSFDLTNATTMDAVWPFISNSAAIRVNQEWAGHPGREVSAAAADGVSVWAKPLLNDRLAVLAVSMQRTGSVDATLNLTAIDSTLPCLQKGCGAVDVWANRTSGSRIAADGSFAAGKLEPHDSAFFIFG